MSRSYRLIILFFLILMINGQEFTQEQLKEMIRQHEEKKKKPKSKKELDMDEYGKIEEYKGPKLWACYLLSECRMKQENTPFQKISRYDEKLGLSMANRAFLDALEYCYDHIDRQEALQYSHILYPENVRCEGDKFRKLLPIDIRKYQNWKSEQDFIPITRQTVLSASLNWMKEDKGLKKKEESHTDL